MKTITHKIILLFVLSTCIAFAGERVEIIKKAKPADPGPPDTHALVASVTPGSAAGTGTIAINGDTPFSVDSNTTIVVDGNTATLKDVKVGMLVLTRTTADSSVPEIDLKTVPAQATSKKHKNLADQN